MKGLDQNNSMNRILAKLFAITQSHAGSRVQSCIACNLNTAYLHAIRVGFVYGEKTIDRVRNVFTNDLASVERAISHYEGIIPPSFLLY